MGKQKKFKHKVNIPPMSRESIFDYSDQFEMLSADEKNNAYLLLITNVLRKIEHVDIIKIENDMIIRKFKKLDFVVKCLYLQPWFW
ncbi:6024_t:CDS:2, partial [Racocetra persica]